MLNDSGQNETINLKPRLLGLSRPVEPGKKIMFCVYNQGNNNTGGKISRTALGVRRWELVLGRVDLPVCAIGHLCVSCSVHARCLEVRSGDAELSHA